MSAPPFAGAWLWVWVQWGDATPEPEDTTGSCSSYIGLRPCHVST